PRSNMRTLSICWFVGIALGGLACSSSSSTTAQDGGAPSGVDGGAPGEGGVQGAVSLHVDSASASYSLDGLAPKSGNVFVVLSMTLANNGSSVPLSTNPVLFSVRTNQSLVITIAAAQPSNPCDPTFSVADGGQISCGLVFEIPAAQQATDLLYDDLRGNKATAAIPAIPVPTGGACGQTESWSKSTSNACSTCLDTAYQSTCATPLQAYAASCASCAQSCDGAADPCACERECDPKPCQDLFD